MNNNDKSVNLLLPLILIISLFFLWGMANNLNDILITQFKKVFTLSDFKAGLVQSAFYTGYFVFSIPAALWMKRFGYKAAVVFGLLLYAAGPARICAVSRRALCDCQRPGISGDFG
jgi:FHS family L-fucose permease-like MFS transporter